MALTAALVVSGCSVHPIPDDVSRIPTEEIVRSARCEMRLGLFDQVQRILLERGFHNIDVRELQTSEGRRRILPRPPPGIAAILDDYGKVAAAYDFEFDIAEHNDVNAGLGFKLPFTSPSVLDVAAGGSINRTRTAKRTFSAQETFGDLILRNDWCDDFSPRRKNLLYPITGSIGLRKVVETFIKLSEQGGGRDSFVDALAFTTTISGTVSPVLKLNPVPHSFRLVAASASITADRIDLHKVKISLAFPVPEKPKKKKTKNGVLLDVDPKETGTAPYVYNPVWRARYNICVADARDREDTLKTLRDSPPEVYCIAYADTFVPRISGDSPPPPLDGTAPSRPPGSDLEEKSAPRRSFPPTDLEERPTPRRSPSLSPQPRTPSWW